MGETLRRDLYPLLGRLLAYPDEDYRAVSGSAQEVLGTAGWDLLVSFERFHLALKSRSLEQIQELYSRTFDLSPPCIPYLSVHLFGEENLKRSRLMVALKERYQEWGFDPGTELPDHLSLVFRSAPCFDEKEWHDFAVHCLVPALSKMQESMQASENPFGHLIEVLADLLQAEALQEITHG